MVRKKKVNKVVITGGGTAGHVFPGLAVASEIQKINPEVQILYLGSRKGFEARYLPKTGFPFISIPTGKIRKYIDPVSLGQNLGDLFRIPFGILKSVVVLLKFKPDVVFATGGYVSLPVGLASAILRIPYLVLESDFQMGLANRILSYFASRVAVSFPNKFYPKISRKKLIFTGNPIRSEVLGGSPKIARKIFDLEPLLPTLLVIGGSQGARKINQAVCRSLPDLVKRCQIIHLVGYLDWSMVYNCNKNLPPELRKRHKIFKFLEKDLAYAYAASDLVVSRGGANVLAEISAYGKPSILIPIPGHQAKNVLFYLESGAAFMISNEKLNGLTLKKAIFDLLSNTSKLEDMAQESKKLAHLEAAKIIAEELFRL